MSETGIKELVTFWKNIYQQQDPFKEIERFGEGLPIDLKQIFNEQIELYPEPYYGYFEDDMTKDALMLLINPGKVRENSEKLEKWNPFVQNRYRHWTKKDYHNEKELLKEIFEKGDWWRDAKKKQLQKVVGNFDFMHTIEFFPYHSTQWNSLSSKHKEWLYNLHSQKLLINAIKEISQKNKVKYIFGRGRNWVDIFQYYGVHPTHTYTIKKKDKKRFSHKIFQFKISPTATPIVIYYSGTRGMHLPTDPEAVETIQKYII